MTDQLIPRAPKRKKQPTADAMREQLRLAADEIIRLRAGEPQSFFRGEPDIVIEARDDERIKAMLGEWKKLPPPPKPPSCRVEYSGFFGRLMFNSMEEFQAWLALPWWRRLFRRK